MKGKEEEKEEMKKWKKIEEKRKKLYIKKTKW